MVQVHTDHIAQLLRSSKQHKLHKKEWDKEKQMFEEKISSLLLDMYKLKNEKWKLQHHVDDLLVKLTDAKNDLSVLGVKCDQFEIYSK